MCEMIFDNWSLKNYKIGQIITSIILERIIIMSLESQSTEWGIIGSLLIKTKGVTVMKDRIALVSYSFATLAGICFVSGLAILASERGM